MQQLKSDVEALQKNIMGMNFLPLLKTEGTMQVELAAVKLE